MTAEQRLSAFLQEGQGPEHDPVFIAEISRRVARRELLLGLTNSAVLAVAAAVVLWACAPALSALIEPVSRMLAPAAAVLTLTIAFLMISRNLSAPRLRL
ncbi:hypothetical protein MCEMIH16_00715 [Caulobacteraceae bacterium]